MKWVKASERLPDGAGIYCAKLDGAKFIGSFVPPHHLYFQADGDDIWIETKEQFENVEWLDETESDELPAFLYEDRGEIRIGMHGDTVVTDYWNEWKKTHR